MRELLKFFSQYRAVHTNENAHHHHHNNFNESGVLHHSAAAAATAGTDPSTLKANRSSMHKEFSILDVFFNKRKAGRGPRWPKGNCNYQKGKKPREHGRATNVFFSCIFFNRAFKIL